LFSLGIEKIVLNSCLHENEQLIRSAADLYGSQSIMVSLDVKKNFLGAYKASFYNGERSAKDALVDLAKRYESLGAGEILLHNIDKDGTFNGLDKALVTLVATTLEIPVIACGGVNSLEDMLQGIQAGASAIAAGSFF